MTRIRLSGAVAFGLVLFLILSGAGASWAYWTFASSTPTISASPAPLSATAAGVNGLNTQYKFLDAQLNTSASLVIKPVTLTNTGAAPLTFSASALTSAATLPDASVKVWLWSAATAGGCGISTMGASGTFAALPAMPAAATAVAAGATLYLCVGTQLTTTVLASQGLTVTATFTFTGRVGANWSTTATAAAGQAVTTQTVFRIAPLVLTCTNMPILGGLLGSTLTLSWAAPAGAASASTVPAGTTTYKIVSNTGASVYSGGDLSHEVTRTQAGGAAANSLSVTATESVYGTTSVAAVRAIVQTTGLAAGIGCGA